MLRRPPLIHIGMDKTYGIAGINAAVFTITIKGVKMKLNFTGGNANSAKTSYATLRTKNKLVQSAIERLPSFNRTIKLIAAYDTDDGTSKPAKEKTGEQHGTAADLDGTIPELGGDEPKPIDGVSNLNEARDYLIKKMNVPYQALNTVEAIKRKASELGVSFPNVEQLK